MGFEKVNSESAHSVPSYSNFDEFIRPTSDAITKFWEVGTHFFAYNSD